MSSEENKDKLSLTAFREGISRIREQFRTACDIPVEDWSSIMPSYPTELWAVHQLIGGWYNYREDKWHGFSLQFQGIFDTEQKAIDACRTPDYFIAPYTLNETLPHETFNNPRAYSPLGKVSAGGN